MIFKINLDAASNTIAASAKVYQVSHGEISLLIAKKNNWKL